MDRKSKRATEKQRNTKNRKISKDMEQPRDSLTQKWSKGYVTTNIGRDTSTE